MLDSLLIKHGFGKCLSATPTKSSQKTHWLDDHKNHVHQSTFFQYIILWMYYIFVDHNKTKPFNKKWYTQVNQRCLLMNPLMHAICYTHLIFIMLSYSLRYQNLSTEIKTPSLNCYCYFRVISVWIQALLILIKLQILMSGTFLKLEDFILSTLT